MKVNNKLALHLAVCSHDLQAVRELLAKRTPFNITDNNGATPLHYAAMNGDSKIIHLLRVHGAKGNIYDSHGETPLHLAAKSHDINTLKEISMMGTDINARDRFGNTALHYAVESGELQLVDFLLKSGARVNYINEHHDTPLSIAYKDHSKGPIRKLLLKHGAKKPMGLLQAVINAVKTANSLRKTIMSAFILLICSVLASSVYLQGVSVFPIISGTLGISIGFLLVFMDKPYHRVRNLEAKFLNGEMTREEYYMILNRNPLTVMNKESLEEFNLSNPTNDNLINSQAVRVAVNNQNIH